MKFVNNTRILNQYLSSVGDGTGDVNAIGDYSVTATTRFIKPATTEIFSINKLAVFLVADDDFAIGYGKGVADLTNGISIAIEVDGVETNVITKEVIKNNVHLSKEFIYNPINGDSKQYYTGEKYFKIDYGQPIKLFGANVDSLVVNLNDDFSSLVTIQKFHATGYIENV